MRALRTGNHLVLVGEMPGGHANERLLERLVAEFAEVCNRCFLGIGRGLGGVERQIGRAALAAHCPALSSSMSAVSLTEAASEAVARSRFALRKTYPEMPMPKSASSATAATRRLRMLHTVPP